MKNQGEKKQKQKITEKRQKKNKCKYKNQM